MRPARLSWNMSEDGVVEVSATTPDGKMFALLDIYRTPMIERGEMDKAEARAFQIFAAERICGAWNSDKDAADIAESHKADPALGLTEWGEGFNAACEQISHEIRRRFKL